MILGHHVNCYVYPILIVLRVLTDFCLYFSIFHPDHVACGQHVPMHRTTERTGTLRVLPCTPRKSILYPQRILETTDANSNF